IRGFTWMFFGNLFNKFSHIFIIGILARLLTPEDFGIIGIILIFVSFFFFFTQMRIGTALFHKEEIDKSHISLGYTLSVLIGVFVCLLFYFIAPYIGQFFNLDGLEGPIRFFSFFFPIKSMNSVSIALLQRDLKFDALVKSSSLSYLFGYGLTSITFALLGYGYWSLIYGQLAILLVNTVILLFFKTPSFSILNSKKTYKDLLFFGSGYALDTYINFFADNTDNLIIGKVLGTSSLGIYSRAFQLFALPASFFGSIYDKVLFPILSSKQSDTEKLSSFYIFSNCFSLLILLPISLILLFNAELIITILLGNKWLDVVLPFQILVIGLFIRFGTKINKAFLKSLGLVYQGVYFQTIYAIMMASFCFIGVRYFGIVGAAAGVLLTNIINYIQVSFKIQTLLNYSYSYFLKLHLSAFLNYFPIILLIVGAFLLEYNDKLIAFVLTLLIILPLLVIPLKNKNSFFYQSANIEMLKQVINNSPSVVKKVISKIKSVL
ncbi:lipopolysaccharide biosynthesis protein, partial [Psychroserpens sp.]|uniref:lipopolysaccharide biosynthesis protein n=1 Tax=Psychroserpens sp. TaxID=2020870 RepID=UPI0038586D62